MKEPANSKTDELEDDLAIELATSRWEHDKYVNPKLRTSDHYDKLKSEAVKELRTYAQAQVNQYVTKLVGKKCPGYDENCTVCEAWKLAEEMDI